MRVLITGATGLLGNNLARLLADQGHHAVCLLRQSSRVESLAGVGCDIPVGDLRDDEFLDAHMGEVDAVVHSAAMIHIGKKRLEASRQVNVEWTTQIARLAAQRSLRMIHVSTVDTLAYSDDGVPRTERDRQPVKPACAYVTSKREAEEAVLKMSRQEGLDAVIVNPGFMVGPYDWQPSSGKMMMALAKGFVPLAPAGGCSVVDVRNVCSGIISAIELGSSGERFILGGTNMSYLELWQMMCNVVNSRGPRMRLFPPLTWLAGWTGDLVGLVTGNEPQVNSAAVKMGQIQHFYSSQKAIDQLGYEISPIRPALEDAWSWFRENDMA